MNMSELWQSGIGPLALLGGIVLLVLVYVLRDRNRDWSI